MSEEDNLNTHQPTCGSGEPSLHDEEILDLHARLLREKKKPILAFHIAPLYSCLCLAVSYFGWTRTFSQNRFFHLRSTTFWESYLL